MNIHTNARFYTGFTSINSNITPAVLGSSQKLRFGVTVLSQSSNSQTIYVGNSGMTVSASGFPLSAGSAVDIPVDNINKVYLLGSGNISWLGA